MWYLFLFVFSSDMCPKPNDTGSALSKTSQVENFNEPYPSLFEALTAEPDTQERWITFTFPVDFDVVSYRPKLEKEYKYWTRKSFLLPSLFFHFVFVFSNKPIFHSTLYSYQLNNKLYYLCIIGGEGLLGFPDLWSDQEPWLELIFYPRGEFQWSPEGPVGQIHSPHLHIGAPGIFSDLLRSLQMLKREWGAESNGKLPHLFNPW